MPERKWKRTSESMTAVDRAWLEMDEPNNPMIVSAIVEFEGVRSLKQLAACIVSRLLQYSRFREYAENDGGPAKWVPEHELRLDYHVRLLKLPGVDPDPHWELRQAIGHELGQGLDRTRPLWRLTLFPRGRHKAVVLFRAHHAVADGIALMQVLLNITDDAMAAKAAAAPSGPKLPAKKGRFPLRRGAAALKPLGSALRQVGKFIVTDLRHPKLAARQLRQGRETLAAVMRLLTLPADNPACLSAPLSGQRAVAWSDTLAFEPVRAFAKANDVKINDVFLTALSGAFRKYLTETDGGLRKCQNLRVSIPVNLRTESDGELGNRFGLVMLDLPIGVEDWCERLRLVSQRMEALKHSPEARAVLASLAVAGRMPVAVEKRLVNYFGAKTATIVSNLPGPKDSLYIGGARLNRLVFWPPQSGGVGVGISLLSYAGSITVGVSADIQLIPDPQLLIAAFNEEIGTMIDAGGVLPLAGVSGGMAAA
jgi:WS/DGAT/MGAT family acyltransferase